MRVINEQELKDILDKHGKWLRNNSPGDWVISRTLNFEYWVSDNGEFAAIFNPCGSLRFCPRPLAIRKANNGYRQISFKGKNLLAHRIVAAEFIGEIGNKIVHHKNGNRLDNRVSNLEITTISKNNSHGHGARKLNKKIITEMIRYYRKQPPT